MRKICRCFFNLDNIGITGNIRPPVGPPIMVLKQTQLWRFLLRRREESHISRRCQCHPRFKKLCYRGGRLIMNFLTNAWTCLKTAQDCRSLAEKEGLLKFWSRSILQVCFITGYIECMAGVDVSGSYYSDRHDREFQLATSSLFDKTRHGRSFGVRPPRLLMSGARQHDSAERPATTATCRGPIASVHSHWTIPTVYAALNAHVGIRPATCRCRLAYCFHRQTCVIFSFLLHLWVDRNSLCWSPVCVHISPISLDYV